MQRRIFLLSGTAILFSTISVAAGRKTANLFKEPACGCCGGYAKYLRSHGIDVTVTDTQDFANIGRDAGVPAELEGCHVTFVDGYTFSGHVPIEAVQKVLAKKPKIAGLTLPGMPAGSPGMPGPKVGSFVIHSFTRDGQPPLVFEVY